MTSLPRVAGSELMDEPTADRAELARSLADIRAVNRWLGGTRVVLHHLAELVERHPRPCWRILDIASGSGDIPLAVAQWARKRGIRMEIVASDNHESTLAMAIEHTAADPAVRTAQADALELPWPDGSFDVALLSTALHHFDDERDCLRVLREMDRVTRVGFIVNDLSRSRPALLGARLLAATVWRTHPVTRHDGPLSVRRSFTASELEALAARAGLQRARVHSHVPFRVALVAEKETSA